MKRAIFRRQSIDICIENGLLCTPIGPDALRFDVGEHVIVATPLTEARGVGEYQLRFTIGEYLGDRPDVGDRLFRRPDWRHAYRLTAVARIEPFSLTEVVAAAGPSAEAVQYQYKGQTQHHRIIRTILPEHEPLWAGFVRPSGEPVASAAAVVASNQDAAELRQALDLKRERIVRRLRAMDKQNAGVAPGREYRSGRSQDRNREFSALVRALYDSRCQVCGVRIESIDAQRSKAQVHHIAPWNGDSSDRLMNVICVCPNHHAMFELGTLRWDGGLYSWRGGAWVPADLSVDEHLLVPLSPAAAAFA